jgi:hypothetical protein
VSLKLWGSSRADDLNVILRAEDFSPLPATQSKQKKALKSCTSPCLEGPSLEKNASFLIE